MACDAHHILVEWLFNNKTVVFLYYLCEEVFWVGRRFVFNYISPTDPTGLAL